jgi:hypothetical protein
MFFVNRLKQEFSRDAAGRFPNEVFLNKYRGGMIASAGRTPVAAVQSL